MKIIPFRLWLEAPHSRLVLLASKIRLSLDLLFFNNNCRLCLEKRGFLPLKSHKQPSSCLVESMDAKGNTEKVKHVVYIPDDAIRAERRKLRFVVIAFICLLVVLLGISLFAIYKSTVAERVAGSSSEMPVKDDERIHNSFKHRSDFKPMEV